MCNLYNAKTSSLNTFFFENYVVEPNEVRIHSGLNISVNTENPPETWVNFCQRTYTSYTEIKNILKRHSNVFWKTRISAHFMVCIPP